MSKNFTLGQLTEGIRDRNVGQDGGRLMNKWTRTGLLRGLNETKRENMARLLENQAAQVLREANQLSGGNIDGFTNIAFPIVRRVFGGLVANELVSIQPMSLPSGLLFYLDYSYGSDVGHASSVGGNANEAAATDAAIYASGESLYGSPSGNSIQTGATTSGGMYDLAGSGFSKVYTTAATATVANDKIGCANTTDSGAYTAAGAWSSLAGAKLEVTNVNNLKLINYDPQLIKSIAEDGLEASALFLKVGSSVTDLDKTLAKMIGLMNNDAVDYQDAIDGHEAWDSDTTKAARTDADGNPFQAGRGIFNLRRLNEFGTWDGAGSWKPSASGAYLKVILLKAKTTASAKTAFDTNISVSYPMTDEVSASGGGTGGTIVVPSFESNFASTGTPIIPEIDIKIESIAVTAQTRKLRARWSPELAQDLNAYHSLDAEVELTQILSEQIALEIDREILNDLLVEAKGANFFWSRSPGKFVNKRSGAAQNLASTLATGPQFTGTVREWYETLVETIIDVANEIHRKTLRGSANFIVVSPEVATIFEASVLYKPSIKIDGQGQVATPFSLGAEAIGSLSNRFTVYKDPYFPRNKILVGYKGGSYLESGYVYAPYVPLIVTPTIFAPEDFTPRKGVMTRYGKKMVRADFYGTVTCLDMDII